MTLQELLKVLHQIVLDNDLSPTYIVGGVPRNILLGRLEEIKDVDLTSGTDDIDKLAILFGAYLKRPVQDKGDGKTAHKTIEYSGISFDFSSNFVYNNIGPLLAEQGIENPSPLMRETYSRDFTVNTLLLDLNLKKIIDLTGKGKQDIEDLILRCPIDCATSFYNNPSRILRAFVLKAEYGFEFSDEVREGITRHSAWLQTLDRRQAATLLNKIVSRKPELLDMLVEMGIMQKLPMTKYITKLLLQNKRILDVI